MKTILKLTFLVLILFSIAYLGGNYVLKRITSKVVSELRPQLEQKGIIIENFNYSDVRLNSYNSFAVRNIDLDFYLNKKMFGKESFRASFQSKSVSIRFADFSNPSLFFTLKDFSLLVEPDDHLTTKTFGTLNNGFIQSRIPLYLKTPEESAREILVEVKQLFRENKTPYDLRVDVDVMLGIDDKLISANLYSVRIDSLTCLKFDDTDIKNTAMGFDLELSEMEAKIISNYPSKVPALIKITRDAKRLSTQEKSKDSDFPEDAFRHVYWSYNLTRELGPQLAKEITDAHETLPGNTQSERAMDFHNNAIGRKYAGKGISINEIRNQVINSADVIRHPDQVK